MLSPTAVSHFLSAPGPRFIQLPPRASRLALLSGRKRGASASLPGTVLSVKERFTTLASLRIRGSLMPLSLVLSIFFWLAGILPGGFTDVTELVAAPISVRGARRKTSECRLGIPWTSLPVTDDEEACVRRSPAGGLLPSAPVVVVCSPLTVRERMNPNNHMYMVNSHGLSRYSCADVDGPLRCSS